jgi:protein O-GlcNAc transferase
MEILKKVDNGVLWLLENNNAFVANIKREAENCGIESRRIIFAPFVSSERNLSRLALADLFLDGLPYNAHTTASDALWAGLPVITCRGKTFAGRVAASLLNSAGLPELVTETVLQYQELAVHLATNAEAYDRIKGSWKRDRLKSRLFDTETFARHMEEAYSFMWENLDYQNTAKCCYQSPV